MFARPLWVAARGRERLADDLVRREVGVGLLLCTLSTLRTLRSLPAPIARGLSVLSVQRLRRRLIFLTGLLGQRDVRPGQVVLVAVRGTVVEQHEQPRR